MLKYLIMGEEMGERLDSPSGKELPNPEEFVVDLQPLARTKNPLESSDAFIKATEAEAQRRAETRIKLQRTLSGTTDIRVAYTGLMASLFLNMHVNNNPERRSGDSHLWAQGKLNTRRGPEDCEVGYWIKNELIIPSIYKQSIINNGGMVKVIDGGLAKNNVRPFLNIDFENGSLDAVSLEWMKDVGYSRLGVPHNPLFEKQLVALTHDKAMEELIKYGFANLFNRLPYERLWADFLQVGSRVGDDYFSSITFNIGGERPAVVFSSGGRETRVAYDKEIFEYNPEKDDFRTKAKRKKEGLILPISGQEYNTALQEVLSLMPLRKVA